MIHYIIDLLKKENTVYINQLGLFEKKFVSAEIKDGSIRPPYYTIVYNSTIEGNGFAFILYYSQQSHKRFTDADDEINTWVENLKKAILNNKSVEIEDFGTFFLSFKDKIQFEAAYIPKLNVDFEGMNAIPLKTNLQEEKEENNVAGKEQEKQGEQELLKEKKIRNERNKKRRFHWLFGLIFAMITLVVALVYIERIPLYLTYKEYIVKIFFQMPVRKSNQIPDLSFFAPACVDTFECRQSTFPDENNLKENSSSVIDMSEHKPNDDVGDKTYERIYYQTGKYYLIAGSFVNEKDAIKHIRTTHLSQLEPKILYQTDNKRIRVCIGVFDRLQEAEDFMNSLKGKYWILQ
jgi:nucleoid DNA-binding protein